MRVLVFHGYLLHGTGSNVYNAELGAALVRGGHEVHMLCQEPDPFSLGWVDAVGEWSSGTFDVQARREPVRATVYRPDIAGVLPLYVADRYAGFDARPFPDLSEEEVERYIALNVRAVRDVVERARPDVALANHLVMGPLILARALGDDVPYAVKVHGSDLTFVVGPYPRFRPHAVEGAERARGLLVGSRHTAEQLWAQVPDAAERTRLGPPGVDVERFAPGPGDLRGLRERLAATAPTEGSSFARDPREAVAALDAVAPEDRLIVFVGKLIGSKGVELLLAAFQRVLAREPRARLLVVGFGAFRPGLERLVAQLDAGDLDGARALRAEDGRELPQLAAYLESAALPDVRIADRVHFLGRLDHDDLAALLPAAEAMAVPSTSPEAFGMVAAEAAACGALPVVADHSGLGEVAGTLREALPAQARGWLSFGLGDTSVVELAEALSGWLEAPAAVRERTRETIVAVTREHYSWDGVARTVIAAGLGELDELPTV